MKPSFYNSFPGGFLHKLCWVCICCFYLNSEMQAQVVNKPSAPVAKLNKPKNNKPAKLPKQKDIIDVLKKVFHRDILSGPDSIEHKKGELHLSVIPAVAYTLMTRTAVAVAANGAFYTDDAENGNLSTINTSLSYTQNHQIIFPIHTSIWTKGNMFNLLGDWRFYRYPQYTYGLGGHSQQTNADLLKYTYITFRETIQKMILPNFYAGFGYNLDYHWDITEDGTADGKVTDFQKYGKTVKSVSSGISLKVLYDTRRNPINPVPGSYASVTYRPNVTFMGSTTNWQYMLAEFRKYIRMPGTSQNILAFWSYNWITLSGKPPYLDLPSTGWDEFNNVGRGYIQSRFRGRNLIYLESEYRFHITRNGLLGGVVFVNAQCVSNYPGNSFDTVWPGMGAGLRIKVNKHSNTNMAIDYGFGTDGSHGLYFGLGEMF
jgi:hypothetical protein